MCFFFQVEFPETNLVITEPYFNFSVIRESLYEVLFEDYQFKSVFSSTRRSAFFIMMVEGTLLLLQRPS
jgi:actin-related protein